MTEKFPSTGLSSLHTCVFSHGQLRQVLSAYSEGVMNKGWRDYAITSDKNQTTFCVVDHGAHIGGGVIYSISATKSNNNTFYRVFDGEKQIFRSENFIETLNIFRAIGKSGRPKSKKLKIIK